MVVDVAQKREDMRSALYDWPAKIEHWPADSNGFFTGKTRRNAEYGRVFRYKFDVSKSAGQCSILAGQL